MEPDYTIHGEARTSYVKDRILSTDDALQEQQLAETQRVVVFNAFHEDEAIHRLDTSAPQAIPYRTKIATEPHFYDPKTQSIYVVNTRGDTRLTREYDLATALEGIVERDIAFKGSHWNNSRVSANRRFSRFAGNLVKNKFSRIDQGALQHQGSIDIVMGPHVSLPSGYQEIFSEENDYLNFKIMNVGNKTVFALDYIFADQAKNVLHEVFHHVNGNFNNMAVNIYHYGKVGLLDPQLQVGAVCVPKSGLDESDIVLGDHRLVPIRNRLVTNPNVVEMFDDLVAMDIHEGTTVNTASVLRQTCTSLKADLDAGGTILEMEWMLMNGLLAGSNSIFPHIRSINMYLAGEGSDNPLLGKTLGNTRHLRIGEKKIAAAYFDMIPHL